MSNNRPAHEIKLANIRATIWSNQNDRGDRWFSVSIIRTYRDGDQWKDANSFGRDDLPLVSKVGEMAYAWIWKQGANRGSGAE